MVQRWEGYIGVRKDRSVCQMDEVRKLGGMSQSWEGNIGVSKDRKDFKMDQRKEGRIKVRR